MSDTTPTRRSSGWTQFALRLGGTLAALAAAGLAWGNPAWAIPVLARAVPPPVADGSAAQVARPAADAVLTLQISLPLRNEAALDGLIADLQDPASPRYRHYLSAADFTARFAPTQADYDALIAYAGAYGLAVTARAPNRRLVELRGSVAAVERALHVTMGLYRHPTEGRLFLAPDREPTLDDAVPGRGAPLLTTPVLAVTGLDDFIRPVAHLVRGQAGAPAAALPGAAGPGGSGPGGQFIGADMRAAYYGGGPLTGAGQSVGLLELAGYEYADVQHYFSVLGQPLTASVIGISVGGAGLGCSGSCDDAEQSLDIEEAIAMAPGLKSVLVYVGSSPLAILNRMASDDAALQLSSSWGWSPDQRADEPVFKEFAAQGQSFVDATGDLGYRLLLGAVWPADDGYVTAVGGTDLVTAAPGGAWASETGWRSSGGGPSPDAIGLPSYQAPFVNALNRASATLRNVPDIAAEANTDNFSCYDGGCAGGNGGTSYAAPRWAGFIALANEQAAAQGKPPVGFVNPTVYRLGQAISAYRQDFHDQIQGFNGRYYDTRGFDLVTGLGSPQGEAMLGALIGK